MRPIFGIVAIVSVPVWLCVSVDSASAQTLILLQRRPFLIDGLSFQKRTQNRHPRHRTSPNRILRLSNLRPEGRQLVVRKSAQPLDL